MVLGRGLNPMATMTKPIEQITACVIDHGRYLGLAVELAKSFGKVFYYNAAAVDAFPTINKWTVADGFPNVEVIVPPDDHWDFKSEIDLYAFPDIYHGGEQLELASQGKLVWGSRHGDRTEILRGLFLKTLPDAGLGVPEHKVIHGLAALREELKDREDVYIKISRYRGTSETFHWRDWDHDESWLDEKAVELGPQKDEIIFYVFDKIETDIEVGMDTYSVDGNMPENVLVGYEWKDKGYFGAVTPFDAVPKPLSAVAFGYRQELANCQYRNFISSEVRIKGDEFYFIDPTRRMPCPASASQMKLYGNLPEIILAGAQGELVQPEMLGQFACECVVTTAGGKDAWKSIRLPESLEDWFVGQECCLVDGKLCWAPMHESHGEELGWLVNRANTPKDCIQGMLDKVAELPDGVTAATDSLVDLLKEIESGQEQGIPFTTKPLPEPAEVIDQT